MRLELENFGQHRALRIESRTWVVMAVGRNRAGKTTLRDAVEFALLGTCALRGFSLKKDVARYMIHEAHDTARVTLVAGDLAIRRTVKSSGQQKVELDRHQNGGWVVVSNEELEGEFPWLAFNADLVRSALEADYLWRLDPEDRAAALVELTGSGGNTAASIFEAFDPVLRADPKRAKRVQTVAAIAAEEGFAVANAVAVEQRREAKRQRAAIPDSEPLPPPGDEEMIGTLDDLRRAMHDAAQAYAEAGAKANQDVGRLQGLREAAAEALKEADAAWQKTSEAVWREFPERPWEDGEEMAPCATIAAGDLVERAKKIGDVVRAQREKVAALRADLEANEAELAEPPARSWTLGEKPGLCPAVKTIEFACPVPAKRFQAALDAARASAEEERAAKAEERERCAEIAKRIRARIEEFEHEIARSVAEAEALLARARRRQELDEANLVGKRAVDLATLKLSQAEKALQAAQQGPTPADVEALRLLGVEAEERFNRRRDWELEVAAEAGRAKQRAEADAEIAWLDAVEKELRPDGVESRLASTGAARMRLALTETRAYLGDVELDRAFELTIGGRHVACASKSEQRVAGLAVQWAVAALLDLPIVVADELDCLDAAWRAQFSGFAASFVVEGERALLGLATSDASPPGTPPPGFATAWLHDGRVEMIEGSADE